MLRFWKISRKFNLILLTYEKTKKIYLMSNFVKFYQNLLIPVIKRGKILRNFVKLSQNFQNYVKLEN